tara:strand:- start:1411 stop:2727 length:1317 start_codon:yes stop_codon:yes gene_type:complete
MNISIIGGGITGLSVAYYLSKEGFDVTVYESSYFFGGQASSIKIDNYFIERGYHHIFRNDFEIINLIDELGLNESLEWHKSSVGMYSDKTLYKFSTPLDLLKYKPISLINRIRLGLLSLYLQRRKDWKSYESISANKWILKYAGKEIYNKVWGPLLKAKFGLYHEVVAMPWFWSKMKTRFASRNKKGDEILGYLKYSFEELINSLISKIEGNGGTVKLNHKVTSIGLSEGSVDSIEYIYKEKKENIKTDIVVCTAPSYEIQKLINFNKNYVDKLSAAKYLGASVFILYLKKQFSPYYWMNIIDDEIPFLGLIEHTNLVSKDRYGDNHILYITNYLPHTDEIFKKNKEELLDIYIENLKKINPEFNKNWILDYKYNSVSAAQPVIPKNYSSRMPEIESPIENLFIGNTTQIYPEDRGTNYSVKIAGEIVSLLKEKVRKL